MSRPIYLDYAAATPLDKEVLQAMQPYLTDNFYNPSALYLASKSVKKDITIARESVARILGAKPSEVIFTAGGTEANNLAINGIMRLFPDAHCVVSVIEHDSVLETAKQYNHSIAPVLPDGRIDLEALQCLIKDNTVLLSVMYANNEIGTVQPLHDIAQIVQTIKKQRQKTGNNLPLYLHTDAAQAANYLDLHTAKLGVDLMTLNGGKIYGPKQTGILYIKTGTQLQPTMIGGGQERSIRSGTENVPGIIGFAAALTKSTTLQKNEAKRLKELQHNFITQLTEKLPKTRVNGSTKFRLPNNIHVTIPGTDNERILMELDERGVQCATGSACSASNDEPSHVLAAIGLSDNEAHSSLRFTMGRNTSEQDIDTVIRALTEVCL